MTLGVQLQRKKLSIFLYTTKWGRQGGEEGNKGQDFPVVLKSCRAAGRGRPNRRLKERNCLKMEKRAQQEGDFEEQRERKIDPEKKEGAAKRQLLQKKCFQAKARGHVQGEI